MKQTLAVAFLMLAPAAFAQYSGTQQQDVRVDQNSGTPYVYHVTVTGRTAPAIDYHHRSGATKVGFQGTTLAPNASGEAKVNSHAGALSVAARVEHLAPAGSFGPEYLTYVLWAISPEGRAINLGEVQVHEGRGEVNVTTDLQSFGLIVTAEPYFAVTTPSDTVVLENVVLKNTVGVPEGINVHYELFPRGVYAQPANVAAASNLTAPEDSNIPFDVYQARNAVRIARLTGAEKYATDSFARAQQFLDRTEELASRQHMQKKVITDSARHTVEQAEDARVITIRAREEEDRRIQRETLEAKADEARTQADNEARERAAAEAARADAQREADRASQEKAEAVDARQQADVARQQAEAARQSALDEQQRLAAQADQARQQAATSDQQRQVAEQQRAQAVQQQQELRSRLQRQLNEVLQTRDTARGLIVNMSDVLFDTGSATLRAGVRERLARVSGILLSYPDLKVEVDGHTDSVGSEDYNQRLSEHRAAAVRDFLQSQGAKSNNISSRGFGPSMPVASNNTASGRQQNRRVEMVVSGEAIGQTTTTTTTTTTSSDEQTTPVPPSNVQTPQGIPSQPVDTQTMHPQQ